MLKLLLVAAVALVIGGCATGPYRGPEPATAPPAAGTVLQSLQLGAALEDRILALDPAHIGVDDVQDTLSKAPAPRIVLIHGGIYPVYLAMSSFAEFLTGMGYPEAAIRRPDGVLDSVYSYSPYGDSAQLAGVIAWYYERNGVRPMMVGHSQGGVQTVKVLDELAGVFTNELQVWNPITDATENRTTIVDPLTGARRPVVGVSVPYASVVGAGGLALILPNQWGMTHRLRDIPDTVDDFTGFSINGDIIALSFAGARGASEFHANGKAKVRNIFLPSSYNHIVVPTTRQLSASDAMRAGSTHTFPNRGSPIGPAGDNANAPAAGVWQHKQRAPQPGARLSPPRAAVKYGKKPLMVITPRERPYFQDQRCRRVPRHIIRFCEGWAHCWPLRAGPDSLRDRIVPGALAGKIALVTGASRGIGRAIAHKLASAGCDVAVNYYNSTAEAEALCAEIRAMGGRACALQASVGIPDSVDDMFA
jgi:hypothetical protein